MREEFGDHLFVKEIKSISSSDGWFEVRQGKGDETKVSRVLVFALVVISDDVGGYFEKIIGLTPDKIEIGIGQMASLFTNNVVGYVTSDAVYRNDSTGELELLPSCRDRVYRE